MAKVVAGYGVVHGLRISFAVRIHRDHDPARDTGGPRGDVAREVVARNLHVPRAQKRDADPREVPVELRGSTRARIVLDRVAFHLEATYRSLLKSVSFEEHASAVVVDRVSGDKASFSVGDVHAPRAARDVVANDLGVVVGPFRPEDGDARFTGAAYVVGDDLGAGRFEDNRADYGAVRDVVGDDPGAGRFFDEHAEVVACEVVGEDLRLGGVRVDDTKVIACEGIVRDSSVALSLKNGDPASLLSVRSLFSIVLLRPSALIPIPAPLLPTTWLPSTVALRAPKTSIMIVPSPLFGFCLKPRIVKPEMLTSLTRCPSSLPVLMFTSPRTQIASGPKAFEQGESALALAGAWITASSPRSFIPFLRITTSSR